MVKVSGNPYVIRAADSPSLTMIVSTCFEL